MVEFSCLINPLKIRNILVVGNYDMFEFSE